MNKLRKFLVASVMTLSVIAMSGLVAPVAPAQAAASAGDLIKMEGLSSVYYLGDDGMRYVFPNESTYFSWYSDFSGVVTIPSAELQSYPLGGNVTMRPGTTLVKITTDPSVYAVEPNGVLRKIQSESQAEALFGSNWNKRIVDLADSFFTNYTIGQPLANGEVPVGSLVKNADQAGVFYFDGTNYRSIDSESAFYANRFKFADVITLSDPISAGGSAITGSEPGLTDTSQGSSSPQDVVTAQGLMVSLNAQTPASQEVPMGVAVEMLKINLTATNDGPVNVNSVTVTALGLSDAENIKQVTFYDGNMKIGSSKNVNNSTREATLNFANPIYVPAGATKTIAVKAELAKEGNSYGLSIAKASHVLSSAAQVTGSFPVKGNLMSPVKVEGLAKLTISSDHSPESSTEANYGEQDVLLADFNLEVDNEDILVQSISLRNNGTNDNDIVSNLVMYINGEEVATGVYQDRYATFILNNYKIEKSDTANVEVYGDMGAISGTTNNIELYVKDNNDVVAIGATHGFGVKVTNEDFKPDTNNTIKVTLQAGDFTIAMDKKATPAKDVKPGDKGVVLATIKMTANSEDVTLEKIKGEHFYIATSTPINKDSLENIALKDLSTGGLYDMDVDWEATSTEIQLGLTEEISFRKGVTKTFELLADVVSDAHPTKGAKKGDTYEVTLKGEALVLEGDLSESKVVNNDEVSSARVTVKEASLTNRVTPLNKVTVVGGAEDVVIYQSKVKAGTADGVKITQVKLSSATSTEDTNTFSNANISKLTLVLNGKEMRAESAKISGNAITFNSLSNNEVPANTEYTLEVLANFKAGIEPGGFKVEADNITSRSLVGNNTVTANPVKGYSRIVTTSKAGDLTVTAAVTSEHVKDSFVLAGSSTGANEYLTELKFKTGSEPMKVKELTLVATSTGVASWAGPSDIAKVKLVDKDGQVVAQTSNITKDVGDGSATTTITFDSWNYELVAQETTSLFVAIDAKGQNVVDDPASTATTTSIAINSASFDAVGVNSGEDASKDDVSINSKTATIVPVKLVSVTNQLADGKLTAGTKTIAKYELVFDNGSNRNDSYSPYPVTFNSIVFNVATSSATATDFKLSINDNEIDNGSLANDKLIFTEPSIEYNAGTITLELKAMIEIKDENAFIETHLDVDGNTGTKYNDLGDILPGKTQVDGATLSVR